MKLVLILFCAALAAQNVNLIPVTPSETAALVAANRAQLEARKIADAKYEAYYNLTQKVRDAHGIKDCAVFTEDFKLIIRGAYSPLNSASGIVTTRTCW